MKISSKILLVMLAIVSFNACKKDEESEPTPPAANVLCDGKGSASYFPLDSSNSWTYDFTIMGIGQSSSPSLYVTGYTTHNGQTYSVTHEGTPFMQGSDRDLREDATTHNIYYYHPSSSTEYLDIPGTPTLNQSYPTSNGLTKKVTNLSASISTGGCSYTGLLEISQYDTTALKRKFYYKKGLGLVSQQDVGSFASIFKLEAVTLK